MRSLKTSVLAATALVMLFAHTAFAYPHRDRLNDYYQYDSSLLGCGAHNLWSGFYLGGSAGWALHDAGWRDRDGWAAGQSISDEVSGWSAGGHAGYNVQCDELVYGLEADWSWADLSNSRNYDNNRYTVSSSLDSYATLRGRFGLATDHVLVYLTGGLAYADVKRRFDLIPLDPCCSGRYSEGKWGWVGGGGIEIARGKRIKFFAEVLYMDFGDDRYNLTNGDTGQQFSFDIDDTVIVARAGVKVHLHHHEPPHYK